MIAVLTSLNDKTIKSNPPSGDPYFTVNVMMPINANQQSVDSLATKIEEKLEQFESIESIITLSGTDFPYLNVVINTTGDLVLLVKTQFANEQDLKKLLLEVKAALAPLKIYANINLSLFQYQDFEAHSPFSLILTGNDSDALKKFAQSIDDQLQSPHPGAGPCRAA